MLTIKVKKIKTICIQFERVSDTLSKLYSKLNKTIKNNVIMLYVKPES